MLSKAEFDLLKLLLLVWFLAPIGYNASDMIFNLVSGKVSQIFVQFRQKYLFNLKISIGCHPCVELPQVRPGPSDPLLPATVGPVPCLSRLLAEVRGLRRHHVFMKHIHNII